MNDSPRAHWFFHYKPKNTRYIESKFQSSWKSNFFIFCKCQVGWKVQFNAKIRKATRSGGPLWNAINSSLASNVLECRFAQMTLENFSSNHLTWQSCRLKNGFFITSSFTPFYSLHLIRLLLHRSPIETGNSIRFISCKSMHGFLLWNKNSF